MDKNELNASDNQIIEKIKDLLEKDDVVVFSNEEIKVIRDMIIVYQTIIAFGKVGSLFKNLVVGLAAFIGAYYIVQNWGVNILKHLLGI